MFDLVKKAIATTVAYIIICSLIFLFSFSFYTKKFPPDFKQVKLGLESISKMNESLKQIQSQQAELLKVDFAAMPEQINSTNDAMSALNQKIIFFENQNDYLAKKVILLEQNQNQLLQRLESLERRKTSN